MKRLKRHFIGTGALLFVLGFQSTLMADNSSDRLACYKANKLVPANLTIPTSGAAATDEVYTFTPASHTWASGTVLNSLAAMFGEYSADDFYALCPKANWTYGEDGQYCDITSGQLNQQAFDYLNAIANGTLNSGTMTPDNARDILAKIAEKYIDVVATLAGAQDYIRNSDFKYGGSYVIDASAWDITDATQKAKLLQFFRYESWYNCRAIKLTGVTKAQLDAVKDSDPNFYEDALKYHPDAK